MVQTPSADRPESGAAAPPPANELKFEAALAELEQIVRNMEGGRLPLEESIAAYRRGSELLKHCQQQLADAERKIQVLENGALRDFDTPGEPTPLPEDAK
jgi:exodeoxyribonuclease VII small subunit